MSKSWKQERPQADRVYESREHAIDSIRESEAEQEILEALRASECEETYV